MTITFYILDRKYLYEETNLIVLGQKYKFTDLEKEKLKRKFNNINQIIYTNKELIDIKNEIRLLLANSESKIIVLNTKNEVSPNLIKYLTNLQFKKKINFMSIEIFLEKYLLKCYIPDNNIDLHFFGEIKPLSFFQYIQKRIFDYIGVFSLFMLVWPILIYSVFRIKKESPGNVIFKQSRYSKNKKIFKCFKMRSMHLNSHHDPYTRENDTRIFNWGKFMRETRIDELPQLLNVLKGDMHFIGPRAEWNILVKDYENRIPYYNERHLVAPGITGWAQVNYPYGQNIQDTKQKLMYDLFYIKNWSLLLEFRIVYSTIIIILSKKGL